MATRKSDPRDNLRPVRTTEEARSRGAAGGRRSGEARRARRTMRELARDMLDSPAPDRLAAQVLAVAPGVAASDVTTGAVMLAGQVNAAAKGNAQAARYVSELAGAFDEDAGDGAQGRPWAAEIGRASCRERV